MTTEAVICFLFLFFFFGGGGGGGGWGLVVSPESVFTSNFIPRVSTHSSVKIAKYG